MDTAHKLQKCATELAERCDGAVARDGLGFNKFDRRFGMLLAESDPETWSDRQAKRGYEMLRKYRDQLSNYGIDFSDIPEPEVEEKPKETSAEPVQNGQSQEGYELRLEDGKFVFDFPKDQAAIDDIKQGLYGRSFDWDTYVWTAPTDARNAGAVSQIASDYNFSMSAQAAAKLETLLDTEGPTSARRAVFEGGELRLYFPPTDRLLEAVKSLRQREFESEANPPYWRVPLTLPVMEDLRYVLNAFEFEVSEDAQAQIEKSIEQMQRRFEWSQATTGERLSIEDELPHDLFPFQRPAVRYSLEAKQMRIAGDMGSGKSAMSLVTAMKASADQIAVVCPSSVKINWAKEVFLWTDYRPSICDSMDPGQKGVIDVRAEDGIRKVQINDYTADIVIINYDILGPHLSRLRRGNDVAIVDEAHKIKNKDAKRSKRSKKLLRDAEYQILLTGTPVRNQPSEIYHPLLSIKQAGAHGRPLGDFWDFHQSYCDPKKKDVGRKMVWDFSGSSNLDELNEALRASCYVRRDKKDILGQLPEKHQMELTVDIDNRPDYKWASNSPLDFLEEMIKSGDRPDLIEEAKKRFDKPLEGALNEIAKEKVENAKRAEHMVRIILLRQLAAEGKLPAVKDWTSRFLDKGGKLVVFAVHKLVQRRLMEMFGDPAAILSEMNMGERQENIERFQEDESCKVMVCSLHAAKEGIDGLQNASSTALFVEYPWSPGDLKQAEARLHRAGQDAQTDIYYAVGRDTIDEYMQEMLQSKREVMEDTTSGTGQTGNIIKELAQNT